MDNLKQNKVVLYLKNYNESRTISLHFIRKRMNQMMIMQDSSKNSFFCRKLYYKQKEKKSQEKIEIEITQQLNEEQINSTVVDFADEHIGGLALDGHNCVQEEILMLIFPEALISMIFIPPMQSHEAVLIQNLKKFSSYSGYERSFHCKNQQELQHSYNLLVIDAKKFRQDYQTQFTTENLERELLKCYSGFSLALSCQPDHDISTGRWGCGIFGGNQYLKTLIQLTGFAKHNIIIKYKEQAEKQNQYLIVLKIIFNCINLD